MITHLVVYKLSDPSKENLSAVEEMLLRMDTEIPQLKSMEVGLDHLHTPRSFDVALITRFDSWDDYQAYQDHPFHQNVVIPLIKSLVERSVAADYES